MESNEEMLEFVAPDHGISFRAKLMVGENPDVIAQVMKQLPLQSMFGHVVISGEAIWLPTRIVHLGKTNMVKRSPGAVYLYAPGQTICVTYGTITESALVNKFAQVLDEDLPKLKALGELVWDKTVSQPRKQIVNVTVRRAA